MAPGAPKEAERRANLESRPGIGPGGAVLQTTLLARDPARCALKTNGAAEENRTPVASLARSHTTTVLPPQIRRTNWLWQAPTGPAAAVRRGMGSGLLTDNPRLPAHPVERRGVAPRYLPCKGRVLLLNDRPEHESAEKKPDKERSWEMDLESLRGRGRVPSPVTSGRITQLLRPDGAPDEDRTRLT